MLRFRSLQQRLIFLLLVPVTLLLFGLGIAGFYYTRATLLSQWRESALLSLERAAHAVDMRLEQPVEEVDLIINLSQAGTLDRAAWESSLRQLPGVVNFDFELKPGLVSPPGGQGHFRHAGRAGQELHSMQGGGMMMFNRARIAKVTNPKFDTASGQSTVAMVFELLDQNGASQGRLVLHIRFDYLLEHIKALKWWKSDSVFLVDHTGRILAQAAGVKKRETGWERTRTSWSLRPSSPSAKKNTVRSWVRATRPNRSAASIT